MVACGLQDVWGERIGGGRQIESLELNFSSSGDGLKVDMRWEVGNGVQCNGLGPFWRASSK